MVAAILASSVIFALLRMIAVTINIALDHWIKSDKIKAVLGVVSVADLVRPHSVADSQVPPADQEGQKLS